MAERILSAGVVVVRESPEGALVLLLRAYNYWDCPKGLVEPGEEPLPAACREVREETGIDDLEFRWGEEFFETEPYSKNKVARYYVAMTRTAAIKLAVNPELGRPEHHQFAWLTFEEARAKVVPRVAAVLNWSQKLAQHANP